MGYFILFGAMIAEQVKWFALEHRDTCKSSTKSAVPHALSMHGDEASSRAGSRVESRERSRGARKTMFSFARQARISHV
jgi:hypothetical protein